MARIKKFGDTRLEKLSTFQTFLVDDNPNSTYFRISEFKDTFTGGKNGFLIEGSEFLKETTEIKIEILDVEGNPIYYEPGDGIPEYYEGISKVIAVHIYEDTPIGIGKITILGELKNYLENGDIVRPVPDEWKGIYNVKWEREFKINRLLSNEDKVRFYKRPKIEIEEISRPIFTTTPTLIEQSGFVNGLPLVPNAGTSLANFSLPTSYLLTISDNTNWTGSVVGTPINLPNLGVQLQSSDLITNKQLIVSTPYVVDGLVQPFFNQPYTASFNFLELNSATGTALSGSFAKINITDLTSFVGDVARVKVFRKSQSEVSDFQFVQEIPLESNEILIDLESSQRNQEVYGLFTPFVIENYWVSSSNNLTVGFNQEFLYNSVKLDSIGTNKFSTIKDVPVNEGVEYTFDFNIRLEQVISNENDIKIYIEGIRDGLTARQSILTIQASNTVLQKSNITANFIADRIDNAKLYFEVSGIGWYISNVSLRASQETAFSPDEITFIQPVPRTLETETFDFRFEFYDINNNYIPVLVEKTQTFDGGNLNRIAKSLELSPSSLYFQFDSGSGTGNPLPPTAIFIDVIKQFLTGSTNFTSRSFDLDNNELSASAYIGEQYPGLLIDEGDDRFRLTVENFTGSKDDTIVQYIEYVAECEGVSDTIVITRVSDGKGGVNFEIRPYRGTVIRNKDEFSTLEIQAVRIDGINETNLVSGLPLNQSDTKLFVQSGSQYLTITEASSSGFLMGVVAGTTGSGQLDYNAVFDRDSIVGQLVIYLIPSSSANREESIVSTITLTDILDGLDAGFIEYDIDVFTINPRTETQFTPISAEVTASYYRRGTTENPISASVTIYPSMSISADFIPEFWLNYFTGSVNSDIVVSGYDEIGNDIFSTISSSFVGNSLSQNKQLTLSFNYIEPYTSESVLVEHTFNIIPEGLPGKDAIIYEIIPSNVALNADPNGTVYDFSPSATEIKVKQGFDYLAFTGSKKPGTFYISQDSVIGNNVTPGLVYFDNLYTQSLLVSASTEFTDLSGSVEYLIEVHPFFTSSFFTQSLIQPYTKLLDGDGARSVTLQASSNVVNFDGNGVVLSPEGDIELTATVFGSTGSLFYQFYRDGFAYSTIQSSNIFEVGSGDAASAGETVLWSVEVRDGSPTSEVRANGSTTIAGVQGGSDSYNVQLTNENASVVQSVFGEVTLGGTGTSIIASKGSTQLEGVTTYPSPQFDQLGTEIPNGKYRVTIHSKPTYITLAGGLASGSVVPVVGGVVTIGDITNWSNTEANPTAQIVYRVDVENGRGSFLKTQSLSVQFEGDTGPGIVFRGEWTGTIPYIYNVGVRRRDAVLRNVDNGVHYWATTELLVTASSAPFTSEPVYDLGDPPTSGEVDAGGWEYLGEQDLFVAAKIAIFEESFVKNTINVGNNGGAEAFANIVLAGGRIDPYIAVGQTGIVGADGVQTGGVIGYDRTGIFMGTYKEGVNKTPRFSLKNGAGDRYFRWDGSNLQINAGNLVLDNAGNLTVTGTINATAGNFNNTITVGSNANKISIIGTADAATTKIFAGVGTYANTNTGFYMDASGRFSLKDKLQWDNTTLTITGNINITGGTAQTDINNAAASASLALTRTPAANGQITFNPTPTGTGLFMTSQNLGYYADSSWQTYMAQNGDFFLTGGNGGLSWNAAASQLVISGSINATDGSIGRWVVDTDGRFRDSDSKIILDADLKGMFIRDAAGDTKLSIRTGDLSVLGGGTVTNDPNLLNHGVLSFSSDFFNKVTFATSNFNLSLNAGQYTAPIDATALSKTSGISWSNDFSGYASITYGYDILNSLDQLITSINLGSGATSFSGGQTSNINGTSGTRTITITTAGSYKIRPFYIISVNMNAGSVSITGNSFDATLLTFSPVVNFAELSDKGLQIVSSANRYVRIERGGLYDIDMKGLSRFETDNRFSGNESIISAGVIRPETNNAYSLGNPTTKWSVVYAQTGTINTSDERQKTEITDSDLGLAFIKKLRPVSYKWKIGQNIVNTKIEKDSNGNDVETQIISARPGIRKHYGLLAQDVKVALGDSDFGGYIHDVDIDEMGLRYDQFISPLIKAIQELSQKVTELELIISGSNNL